MSSNSPANFSLNQQSFNRSAFQDQVNQFLIATSYHGLSPLTLKFYYFHLPGFERYLSFLNEAVHVPRLEAMEKIPCRFCSGNPVEHQKAGRKIRLQK